MSSTDDDEGKAQQQEEVLMRGAVTKVFFSTGCFIDKAWVRRGVFPGGVLPAKGDEVVFWAVYKPLNGNTHVATRVLQVTPRAQRGTSTGSSDSGSARAGASSAPAVPAPAPASGASADQMAELLHTALLKLPKAHVDSHTWHQQLPSAVVSPVKAFLTQSSSKITRLVAKYPSKFAVSAAGVHRRITAIPAGGASSDTAAVKSRASLSSVFIRPAGDGDAPAARVAPPARRRRHHSEDDYRAMDTNAQVEEFNAATSTWEPEGCGAPGLSESKDGDALAVERDLFDQLRQLHSLLSTEELLDICAGLSGWMSQLELFTGQPLVALMSVRGDDESEESVVLLDQAVDESIVTELHDAIDAVVKFDLRNRSGIPGTLHRVSRMISREGKVDGITVRIGRHVSGAFEIIKDLLDSKQSILFIGPPGVGKTTLIRSCVRYLSEEAQKSVIIVDSTNEIAGVGTPLHPAVGRARRMEVPSRDKLFEVMLEAVENHSPRVIVVDELGSPTEAAAAQSIAQRGVRMLASVHGSTLADVLRNKAVNGLLGGVASVTYGDASAYASEHGGAKIGSNRTRPSVFPIAIEMRSSGDLFIHPHVDKAVDLLLKGKRQLNVQHRVREDGLARRWNESIEQEY